MKIYNNKNNKKINTKSLYNEWAILNNFPISDELEEKGFNDFKWLFDIKDTDYLSWNELKKVCKEYQEKYSETIPNKIYELMLKENINIPHISMLNQTYKGYQSMRDIFSFSL